MMIKAQARKLGSPAHAVNYLLRDTDAQGVVRKRVQTICGTPQAFVNVASRLAFNKPYDSLVFGFAPSDKPTPRQIQGFVRAFEHTAFPGMRNRVCWLVVLHESELSVHLHIVVARVDLFTGKQLCVLAHGARPLRKLCELWNSSQHWASVHDSFRAQLASWAEETLIEDLPGRALPIGTKVHDFARKLAIAAVLDDRVACQADMERELAKVGPVVRRDVRSITLSVPGIAPRAKARNSHVRLAGLLYAKDFDRCRVLQLLAPTPVLAMHWKRDTDEEDLEQAARLKTALIRDITRHAAEVEHRYAVSKKRSRHSVVTEIALATGAAVKTLNSQTHAELERVLVTNSLTDRPHERPFPQRADVPHGFDSRELALAGNGPEPGQISPDRAAPGFVPTSFAGALQRGFRRAFDTAVRKLFLQPLQQLRLRVGGAARASGAGVGTGELPGDLDNRRIAVERATAALSFLDEQKQRQKPKPVPALKS